MTYVENPKTRGSGILCAIPQRGRCPVDCADCFFQGGRSYLEPLDEYLPNLPDPQLVAERGAIVRMNDGNDSNVERHVVVAAAREYRDVFFNTSIPWQLEEFPGPVVFTVNPGPLTDAFDVHLVDPVPPNLMFVRFRVNPWNLDVCDRAVDHYTGRGVPLVLTFLAYFKLAVPEAHRSAYEWRTRTLNPYWVITPAAWSAVVARYAHNPLVYTCGKDARTHACSRCGNCLREYHATKTKLKSP